MATPDSAAALPGPEWLRACRLAAAERVAAEPLPSEAEEIWRYSRIGQLDLDAYTLAAGGDGRWAGGVPRPVQAALAAIGERSATVVCHHGQVVSVDVDPALAARGLAVGDASRAPDGDHLVGRVAADGDVFSAMNLAFLSGAVSVVVPPGLVVERPVMVLHWTDADAAASFPRTIVRAGDDSQVTVIERVLSADVAALVAPVVGLDVGPAARVGYVNVQELGPRVWQIGHQGSKVGRDATLRSSLVAMGGDYARVRTDARIDGQGGSSLLDAVYFTDGQRMHDFRTVQDHAAPSSTSDLLFKGAVQDQGRSVYSGLIRVRKEAVGTNAFQTNRNLVLSEGASAESVPNLEIETNDVRCSHASAVGPIDEDQLFYLESRGVPPEAAERLIVMGFFGEVLGRLPVPELVGGLRRSIVERLSRRSS